MSAWFTWVCAVWINFFYFFSLHYCWCRITWLVLNRCFYLSYLSESFAVNQWKCIPSRQSHFYIRYTLGLFFGLPPLKCTCTSLVFVFMFADCNSANIIWGYCRGLEAVQHDRLYERGLPLYKSKAYFMFTKNNKYHILVIIHKWKKQFWAVIWRTIAMNPYLKSSNQFNFDLGCR